MPEPKDDTETKKTYAWTFDKDKINCCESQENTCNVSKLWEASTSPFHDAELQQATNEINAILDEARRTNRDRSRELHFIQIDDRHLLAWVHSDLVSSRNDPRTIAKLLRVKRERTPRTKSPEQTRKLRGGKA